VENIQKYENDLLRLQPSIMENNVMKVTPNKALTFKRMNQAVLQIGT
jgi:hypothetical protein